MKPEERYVLKGYTHLAKEPFITSKRGANAENRFWAKAIDLVMIYLGCAAIHYFFPWLTYVFAAVAWGYVDSLGRGQSPGKWLLGLHTIEVKKGLKANFYSGFIRNLAFFQLTVGAFWPGTIGFLLMATAFAWLCLEAYFTFQVSTGVRVGDILGYTRVFDYKDAHTQFIEQFLLDEHN